MNIFQGFRKLLFCVIAACTGMVVGYQLSRVLFANVRLCLGIGAVCAVILGILAFRFLEEGTQPISHDDYEQLKQVLPLLRRHSIPVQNLPLEDP